MLSFCSWNSLSQKLVAALTVVFVNSAPVDAQTDDLARCVTATPQFPEACTCVIDRAQAAGITGETLSRLLSNQVEGVAIATFQTYGGIYVQCIQQAVLGTVPMPQITPPIASPQVTAPPIPPIMAPTVTQVPNTEQVQTTGQWSADRFALRHDAVRASATAVTERGRRATVFCDPRGGAHLLLDGVQTGPGVAHDGELSVLRGSGARIISGGASHTRVEGDHIMISLYAAQIEALGAGSVAEFHSAAHGLFDRVGLSGSAAALRALQCVDRNPYQVPPVTFEFTGDWSVSRRLPEEQYNGGFLAGIDTVGQGDVGLACGDHFHMAAFSGIDPNQPWTVRVTVDDDPLQSFLLDLTFNRGAAIAFDALPDGFFRTVRAGRTLRVQGLGNSTGAVSVYDLSGLEAALQQIGCPLDAGTPIPPVPDGWHMVPHVNSFDGTLQMLRRVDGALHIAFGCYPGASLDLMIGPIAGYRVLSAPATLRVGSTFEEVSVPLDATDWTTLRLPVGIVTTMAQASALAVTVPAGLDLSIPLADARSGISALGCAAPQPLVAKFDAADLDFSGVDTQPWDSVATQDLGQLLVMRGLDAPPGALHIGCSNRFALPVADVNASSETLPVSFLVGTETYPRAARDFRRNGPWWVLDAPDLYAEIVQAPFFAFAALTPRRPSATYGTAGLEAALQAMCP